LLDMATVTVERGASAPASGSFASYRSRSRKQLSSHTSIVLPKKSPVLRVRSEAFFRSLQTMPPELEVERHNFIALSQDEWDTPPADFQGNVWKDKAGVLYNGTWKNGEFFGEAKWPDGTKSVGKLVKGQATGNCVRTLPDGTKLSCTFVNGRPEGPGVEVRPDGSHLRCEWSNGFANGHGVETRADGSVFTIRFENGRANGSGMVEWPDGSRLNGMWHKDLLHGTATITTATGDVYKSAWKSGTPYGVTVITTRDGKRIMAQLQNGRTQMKQLHRASALMLGVWDEVSEGGSSKEEGTSGHWLTLKLEVENFDLGLHMTPDGVVYGVDVGSPAARAQLREGDIIGSVDMTPVGYGSSAIDLLRVCASSTRTIVSLDVWRGPKGSLPSKWQYEEIDLPPVAHHMEELGFTISHGGAVLSVDPNSSAYEASLRQGDLIVEVDSVLLGVNGLDAWKLWDESDNPGIRVLIVARRVGSPSRQSERSPSRLSERSRSEQASEELSEASSRAEQTGGATARTQESQSILAQASPTAMLMRALASRSSPSSADSFWPDLPEL